MTKEDLQNILDESDKRTRSLGLEPSAGFTLLTIRKNPTKGFEVRTPFGICPILSSEQKEDGIHILFIATRKQIKKVINQLEKFEATKH